MLSKKLSIITLFTIVVAIFIFIPGKQDEQTVIELIRPVRTMEVLLAPKSTKSRFSGMTQSVDTFNVSFRVPGNVIEFSAQVGTPLKNGELIVRLDNGDYITKLEQQKSALSREEASANNAESRFHRVEKLYKKGIVSAVDFENTQAEYLMSKEKVSLAQREIELAQEQLNHTELRTTSDRCIVTESMVSEQENVMAGTVVAILSCGDLIEVQATVSESAVGRISLNQEVEVAFNNSLKGKTFTAKISEIGLSSSVNGAYLVTAIISESSHLLRSGMAAELVITRNFDVSDEDVWVPMIAVGEESNEKFVFVYIPHDKQTGLIKKVVIETNRHVKGMIEVTNGLTRGQQVVTAGLTQISDGLKVKLHSQGKGKS